MSLQQLAAELDLDVYEVGICHACLSFVSFPLDDGDKQGTARAVREFAPILWDEGLAEPLKAALSGPGAAVSRARTGRSLTSRPLGLTPRSLPPSSGSSLPISRGERAKTSGALTG